MTIGDRLPSALLLPFHEIRAISWDEAAGTGRLEAARKNRIDDWFYGCHFLSDPVMPGCWGIDAVWQALRHFAAWRGIEGCDNILGMDGVSFFGQIRPYDGEIVYEVDVLSIERDGQEAVVTGKATVKVDGVAVYTIERAQVGTAFFEGDGRRPPDLPAVSAEPGVWAAEPFTRKLAWEEFVKKSAFSKPEVIALSRGGLVENPPGEMGLLPASLMLEVHEVQRIVFDAALGEGEILASRANLPTEWFFPMNAGTKPTALLVDGIWQLLGLFLAWSGNCGTGRALGFERVEVFDAVRPEDALIVYKIKIIKAYQAPLTGDAFARADAEVFADGRKVLSCANANVGCHKNIRYSDYPQKSELAFGGKLRVRAHV